MAVNTQELNSSLTGGTAGWREFWHRFSRNKLAVAALFFILICVLLAIIAPFITTHDPQIGDAAPFLTPGSPGAPLGTNHLGHDVWTSLVYGGRVSLTVGFLAALSSGLIGILIGSLAGFFGGWLDGLLMRISEFFQIIPRFVLALVIVAISGSGLGKLILVIAILAWPQMARLVRAQFLSLREATFVEAARVGGMGPLALILREILPNALAPVVVTASLDVASAILLEAALGFFGLGDPNLVSWGTMLNDAQAYLRQAWWMAVFPGLAITLVVLALNVVGDGLNDALNPRLREVS
jgi:peptide/nickel transport system permease protein